MNLIVSWVELIALIEPNSPAGETGRQPFEVATKLCIHFPQQWFGLSEPAMEEALSDVPLCQEFEGLDAGATRMPNKSAILYFRHLLESDSLRIQLLKIGV